MAASSASTSSTKASMSRKASHEAGEVLAVLTAVPIYCWSNGCCDGRRHNPSPSHASAPIHLKVASGQHRPARPVCEQILIPNQMDCVTAFYENPCCLPFGKLCGVGHSKGSDPIYA